MGRSPRADEAGGIYHALNRGNAKSPIFFKEQDYAAFDRIVSEALEKFPVHLIAYQWMNNHWHMVPERYLTPLFPLILCCSLEPISQGFQPQSQLVHFPKQ